MAVKFLDDEFAVIEDVGWLSSFSSISVYARVRWDTISANDQYIFAHRDGGGTPKFSISKREDGEIKFSLNNGEKFETSQTSTGFVSAGTVYDIAATWQKDTADGGSGNCGIELFVDGVSKDTGSTTEQNLDYTLSNGDLKIGNFISGFTPEKYFEGTIERLMFFPGAVLTIGQIGALGSGYWPHTLNISKPAAFYPMHGSIAEKIADASGNGRHIGDITGGSLVSDLGQWSDPHPFDDSSAESVHFEVGAPQPNEFQLVQTISHPTNRAVISGLTTDPETTYEFYITAVDAAGNVSGPSATVEGTPLASISAPTTAIPWKRSRSVSKFTS